MRSRLTVVAAAVAVGLSGCGLVGGGTTLRLESVAGDCFRFDDLEPDGLRYFRMSGVDLCTEEGDDEVTVTGVRLVGADAPEVVAFRVSRSSQDVEGSGSSGRISDAPVSDTDGPSGPFSHRCGDDGRVSLTVDTSFNGLPVETDRLAVTYRVDGDERTAELRVPVVLCGPSVGCPSGGDG